MGIFILIAAEIISAALIVGTSTKNFNNKVLGVQLAQEAVPADSPLATDTTPPQPPPPPPPPPPPETPANGTSTQPSPSPEASTTTQSPSPEATPPPTNATSSPSPTDPFAATSANDYPTTSPQPAPAESPSPAPEASGQPQPSQSPNNESSPVPTPTIENPSPTATPTTENLNPVDYSPTQTTALVDTNQLLSSPDSISEEVTNKTKDEETKIENTKAPQEKATLILDLAKDKVTQISQNSDQNDFAGANFQATRLTDQLQKVQDIIKTLPTGQSLQLTRQLQNFCKRSDFSLKSNQLIVPEQSEQDVEIARGQCLSTNL